jgi:hypothetical protein
VIDPQQTGWSLIRETRAKERGSFWLGVLSLIVGFGVVLLFGRGIIDALPDPGGGGNVDCTPTAFATCGPLH